MGKKNIKQLKVLLPYLSKYKKKVFLSIFGIIILSIISIPLPYLNGKCVDLLTQRTNGEKFYALIIGIAIISLLKTIISYNTKNKIAQIGNVVIRDLKIVMINTSLKFPMAYWDSVQKGYIYTRINECEKIKTLFSANLISTLINIFDLALSLVAIFYVDWRLAIVTLLFFPLIYMIIKNNAKKLSDIIEKMVEISAIISNVIINILENVKFVKLMNLYDTQADRAKNKLEEVVHVQNKYLRINNRYQELIQLLSWVHSILILGVAGSLIFKNELSIGMYMAYTGYSSKLFGNVLAFSSLDMLLKPVIVSLSRIKEFLEIPSEGNGEKDLKEIFNISFKNLDFSYFNKKGKGQVFKDFSLSINKNDTFIIMGNNGAGKTTLISLMTGLYEIEDNKIFINNVDIKKYNKKYLRDYISYMPQEAGIFQGTLKENLLMGFSYKINIEKKLKELGLEELLERFNYNYNFIVQQNGINLSGGQKQIISFLRIALSDKNFLILDEPTNSLDYVTRKIIIEYIRNQFMMRKTLLIITHDQELKKEFENFKVKFLYLK